MYHWLISLYHQISNALVKSYIKKHTNDNHVTNRLINNKFCACIKKTLDYKSVLSPTVYSLTHTTKSDFLLPAHKIPPPKKIY